MTGSGSTLEGRPTQRKTLIEGLIEHITITGPDRFVPTFRIPRPTHDAGAETNSAVPTPAVRAMTQVVELRVSEFMT